MTVTRAAIAEVLSTFATCCSNSRCSKPNTGQESGG